MPAQRTTRRVVTTAAAAACLVGAGALPAFASGGTGTTGSPTVKTLTTSVYAPFQLAYSGGRLLVADGATSKVSALTSSGLTTLATGPQPGEVAGVARSGGGELAYTSSDYTSGQTYLTVERPGRSTLRVNLKAFEKAHNPDSTVTYGIDNPTPCQVKALSAAHVPAHYKGAVDSHPYAVASLGKGSWAVADAAGNDLLRVDPRGSVSVIKVLPRQPFTITAAAAAAVHLPKCVVGAVYNFEPVPTDVEMGPDGWLYSSLLPGGPEDASFGARGSVYRVDPANGHYQRLATGFAGATNVAVTSDGSVYVAELFGGDIAKVSGGMAQRYLSLPGAISLVAGNGHLYAGTLGPTDSAGNPTGPGSIVQIH